MARHIANGPDEPDAERSSSRRGIRPETRREPLLNRLVDMPCQLGERSACGGTGRAVPNHNEHGARPGHRHVDQVGIAGVMDQSLPVMGPTLEDLAIAADTRFRREILLTLEAFADLRLSLSGVHGASSQELARLTRLCLVSQFIMTVMLMIWFTVVL